MSQGHYVFHDFRYQFIFRDVKDIGREESGRVNWSSEYVIVNSLFGVDEHGRTWTDNEMIRHEYTHFLLCKVRQNYSEFLISRGEIVNISS